MSDKPKDAVVKIDGRAGQSQPVIVNLRRIDVPFGEEVPLAGTYVEALENSGVQVSVVRELARGEKALGADGDDAPEVPAPVAQKPGGDNLTQTPAVEAIVEPAQPINQKPGGDNLAHGAGPPVDTEQARADATERQQEAADGTIEPVVVLPPEPASAAPAAGSSLNKEPFDAATTLTQSITKITEDMDEFDASQLRRLLKAEKADKNRTTLTAAIERKLASL